jgi:hypothetical protein
VGPGYRPDDAVYLDGPRSLENNSRSMGLWPENLVETQARARDNADIQESLYFLDVIATLPAVQFRKGSKKRIA